MRAPVMFGIFIFSISISCANTEKIIYTHTTEKQKTQKKIIKTNAPFTHFCLNFLGIASIIKGAGIHVPVIRSCVEIKRVNFYYLSAGILLLTTSQVLRYLEQKKRSAQLENNTQNTFVPVPTKLPPAVFRVKQLSLQKQ